VRFSDEESPWPRWWRRAATIPAYFFAATVLLATLPLLLPVAAVTDLLRGKRLTAARLLLAIAYYFVCETIGLLATLVLWLWGLVDRDPAREQKRHLWLQGAWARALFAGLQVLFRFRVELSGEEAGAGGPVFVFMRHCSILDTLLPSMLLYHRHGLRLRYVLKQELLWDPCLDVVGQRLQNVFVRRASEESLREIERVRRLAQNLGSHDGVLIYPEGTRFTPEKRAHILARLERQGDERRHAAARRLTHLLPPRHGGPLALLEVRPDIDVLFLAHCGFEGVARLRDFWAGHFLDRTIRVRMWRVPGAGIPADSAGRAAWLEREWRRMDEWLTLEHVR